MCGWWGSLFQWSTQPFGSGWTQTSSPAHSMDLHAGRRWRPSSWWRSQLPAGCTPRGPWGPLALFSCHYQVTGRSSGGAWKAKGFHLHLRPLHQGGGLHRAQLPSCLSPGPASHHLLQVRQTSARSGQRPAPPSSKDRTVMCFAGRSHQCAFQASAAANNISVLAYSPEQTAEIGKASSATLILCSYSATPRRGSKNCHMGSWSNPPLEPPMKQSRRQWWRVPSLPSFCV